MIKKFHEIFTRLSSIKNENITFRNDLTPIKSFVDLLKSAVPMSNANKDVFVDFINSQIRFKNIIIFNVNEQSNHNNTSDIDTETRIFDKLGTDENQSRLIVWVTKQVLFADN